MPPRLPHRRTPLRAALTALALALAGLSPLTLAPGTAAAPPPPSPSAEAPDLGERVVVFDPSMPVAQIQDRANAIWQQQVDAEMSEERWSLLFKPGTYGTAAEPLQIKVGYYTEVAGLGASPSDTVINGKVEVYNRCLTDAPTQPYCVALNNFWRSMSNLTIQVNGTGQDGCRASANFWATSQAASLRRVDVRGGNLSLMDYCTAGPQFASGGYLADSRTGLVINGSQQQWLTRNSEVGEWSNGVWNQVFAGTVGAPSEAGFPTPPYTTLDRTPISREKPFLHLGEDGGWQVRVPDAQTDSRGISWAAGPTAGRDLPLSSFHVATPAQPASVLAKALDRGRNLLLTPGVYDVDRSLVIRRDDTVVLGMGQATLTAVGGATPRRTPPGRGCRPRRHHRRRGHRALAQPHPRPGPARQQAEATHHHAQHDPERRLRPRRRSPHRSRRHLAAHRRRRRADRPRVDLARRPRSRGLHGRRERGHRPVEHQHRPPGRRRRRRPGQRDRPVRRALPGVQHRLDR